MSSTFDSSLNSPPPPALRYRALNPLAVASVALGVLSIANWLTWYAFFVPSKTPDPVVDPLSVPTCAAGSRPGGAMRTCAKACDPTAPCDKGHCEPWPTGGFCAVP